MRSRGKDWWRLTRGTGSRGVNTRGASPSRRKILVCEPKATMQKVLSTYLFVSRKLTPELLAQIKESGFSALEIFCSRGHFDYGSKQEIATVKSALEAYRLTLNSMHAPTSRDLSATRGSGNPLSIWEIEPGRRSEASGELKRPL